MAITVSLIWNIWIVRSHEFNFLKFLLLGVTKQITWSKFSDRQKKTQLWNHQLISLSVRTVSFWFQSILFVIFDEKVSFRPYQTLKCVFWQFFFVGRLSFHTHLLITEKLIKLNNRQKWTFRNWWWYNFVDHWPLTMRIFGCQVWWHV